MYHEVRGQLVWVAEHEPRWKDWRGRMMYRNQMTKRPDTTQRS